MLYRKDVGHISRFLKEVDLFSGLAERNLDRIASLRQRQEMSFAAGDLPGARDEWGGRLYIARRGIIMNRYRCALELSDNVRRAAHNDPSWMGAEV